MAASLVAPAPAKGAWLETWLAAAPAASGELALVQQRAVEICAARADAIAIAPRSGPLLLGMRPEHADLNPAGKWPLQVEMLEMLGAERLVYGRLGDAAFTLRIEGTRPPPKAGETVNLLVEPGHMHWFDAGSGQRV